MFFSLSFIITYKETFLSLTLLHKPLLWALNLCAPRTDKIMSNLLHNSPWKIGVTFPNVSFVSFNVENCLQALFYILIYVYSQSHRKLAFAQRIFVHVENDQVKVFRKEANQLKSIL